MSFKYIFNISDVGVYGISGTFRQSSKIFAKYTKLSRDIDGILNVFNTSKNSFLELEDFIITGWCLTLPKFILLALICDLFFCF